MLDGLSAFCRTLHLCLLRQIPARCLMQLRRPEVQRNRRQLRQDGHRHHCGKTGIIQYPQQPASHKPKHAERAFKNTVSRRTAAFRHHTGHGRFQNRFLCSHPHTPQCNAQQQQRYRMKSKNEIRRSGPPLHPPAWPRHTAGAVYRW